MTRDLSDIYDLCTLLQKSCRLGYEDWHNQVFPRTTKEIFQVLKDKYNLVQWRKGHERSMLGIPTQ